MKRIKLMEIKAVDGTPFKDQVLGEDSLPVMDIRKDSNGNTILAVPRDSRGEPYKGVEPEPVYAPRTKPFEAKECLPMLLKRFFFNIPNAKLTRQDSIYGQKMFGNIDAIKDGFIEIDDDVHKWIRDKLQMTMKNADGDEQELGILIFGVNLAVVETALDQFERPHEGAEKKNKAEAAAE